ncbi:MAG: tRNA pseudouridine(38-40) synthase TruA [Coriobacteriales bacterium]|jgi:tRNA pseudouridine38-40 synthase|nr:tRNA pseudouridine(38-40) synthase TruA [Coriobacteriales bacterium]
MPGTKVKAENVQRDFELQAAAALALTVAYRGDNFSGFARQDGRVTIQGELEEALATVLRRPVLIQGAGRTDAGVHALGQVVSCGVSEAELQQQNFAGLQTALNALLPAGIVIKGIEAKEPNFSARFSAQAREYRYRLYPSPTPPLFLAPYVWWVPPVGLESVAALKSAARLFEGEQDFKSFCVAKTADRLAAQGLSTHRNLLHVHVFGAQHLGEQCLIIQVIGNAFLHSMVRIMVGSLVEVLLGRRAPEWISAALAACQRQSAGPTAPAQGLTLWRVRY